MNRSPLPLDLLSLSSPAETPEEQLLRSDRVATLARAIATLPERDQTLLSLYYVEGLTYREIAKIFGVSEPRISQLRGRALRRLREAIEAIDAEIDRAAEAGEAINAG
jgi:RNA polymerase sigma factor for flagellar operon FliA